MIQPGKEAPADIPGGAAVPGRAFLREKIIKAGNGIILPTAQGVKLCAQQPDKVRGVGMAPGLLPAVEQDLLKRRERDGTGAGYCGQDLPGAADPAQAKKAVR